MHTSISRLLSFAKSATGNTQNPVIDFADLGARLEASSAVITNWKTRGVSKEGALKAEKVFGCSASWVLTGEGEAIGSPYSAAGSTSELPPSVDTTGSNITHGNVKLEHTEIPQYKGKTPVVANLRVGQGEFYQEEPIDEALQGWVPSTGETGVYGVRVKGDGLYPVFKPDTILLVKPGGELATGESVLVGWNDGRKAVREFLRKGADAIAVMSIMGGPQQTIDLSELAFAHPIIGTMSATQLQAAFASVAAQSNKVFQGSDGTMVRSVLARTNKKKETGT